MRVLKGLLNDVKIRARASSILLLHPPLNGSDPNRVSDPILSDASPGVAEQGADTQSIVVARGFRWHPRFNLTTTRTAGTPLLPSRWVSTMSLLLLFLLN